MTAPLAERLRKAALTTRSPLPVDVVARVEHQETLEALLNEAAAVAEAPVIDASMSAWGDVIEGLVNTAIELTDDEGEFFEEYVSGGARVTFFYHTLAALREAGYMIVKAPDEAE